MIIFRGQSFCIELSINFGYEDEHWNNTRRLFDLCNEYSLRKEFMLKINICCIKLEISKIYCLNK